MLNKLKVRFILLTFALVFWEASSFGEDFGSRWLVSPELLRHSRLKILWENELPFKKGESLRDLEILGGRIYAVSDRNYMVSMDRENGRVIFSRSVGPVDFPLVGLEVYKDELFSIIGNKLVELNPDFGTERSVERLSFSAVCPAGRNSSHFYVGGTDKRMHALRAEDKLQIFEVAADDDSRITSVVASEGFVVFGTDGGNVISVMADGPKRLWQFDAVDAIVGPIVKDGGSLFFASEDTYVYRIRASTGKLIWKYQTAAKLEESPRVTRGVVYQYVLNKGVSAIDKASGALMWQLAEGADLLAEAGGRAYVITKPGELVVMDNNRGKQLYSVNFASVSRYAVNVLDSKIYIADKAGRIACLKQIED